MSLTTKSKRSLGEKLALAGGAASLGMCSATIAEGAIIASSATPISPPSPYDSINLDVDGDGDFEFRLSNASSSYAWISEHNARMVAPLSDTNGFAKLPSGFVVGSNMVGHHFNLSSNGFRVSSHSAIDANFGNQGWAMGDTGFFGFVFFAEISQMILYGWGEMVIDPANNGTAGHGYTITRLYYDDTGAPITVGDTGGGGAVPEPSTCALALLAAGGVAAYRARRKVNAA